MLDGGGSSDANLGGEEGAPAKIVLPQRGDASVNGSLLRATSGDGRWGR